MQYRILLVGYLLLGVLLVVHHESCAQLQATQWYFGQQAGLDFRVAPPLPLANGLLISDEGCSSRADSLGNLLFYTNGATVWNRQHQVMAGGTGLSGNISTTQHLVVAAPGSHSLYYIFSPDEYNQRTGFRYALVDMRPQGGLGAVTRQSELVSASSTERVTAVPHANGQALWIIGHERDSDIFFAYLLDKQGLTTQAVQSRGGFVHRQVQVIGQLKASPNGRRLALTAATIDPRQTQGVPSVELLDFDPATGRITNPVLLSPPRLTSYGVEFSPDGTKLYTTDPFWGGLFQYDLTAPDLGASVVQIQAPGATAKYALQSGPDGRIYVAHTGLAAQALGVIAEPNRRGAACAYSDQGIGLGGRQSTQGLPSFMAQDLWHFTVRGTCQQEAISFAFPTIYGADSVRWNFSDAQATNRNTATSLAPTHTYRAAGRYLVTLTLYLPNGHPFVLRRYVDIAPLPRVNLGRDTLLCPGNTLRLDATLAGARYRWQDGSTAAERTLSQAGTYWVDVTSAAGCTARDSLRLGVAPVPCVRLGADTVLCVGQTVTLRPIPAQAGGRYRWQDGSTAATLRVSQPGMYWVEGTNAAGCSQRDSIRVIYLTPPAIHLGRDTTLCKPPEQPFALDATLPGVRYRWQDGSTQRTFTPTQSGTYWVTVSTPVCSATDSIKVRLYGCQQQVFVPNIITPNGDGKNDRLEVIGLDAEAWSLSIFNRWGQSVYATRQYRQEWDAAGLADGVYYYLLSEPTTQRRVKGQVQVTR